MKKFLMVAVVWLFLAGGTGWARKKSQGNMDSPGSGSKHHSHKKGAKGSKGSGSKSQGEFKVESEINQSKMTFDFKDNEKGKKKGKSKKKKDEESSDIPLEDSK